MSLSNLFKNDISSSFIIPASEIFNPTPHQSFIMKKPESTEKVKDKVELSNTNTKPKNFMDILSNNVSVNNQAQPSVNHQAPFVKQSPPTIIQKQINHNILEKIIENKPHVVPKLVEKVVVPKLVEKVDVPRVVEKIIEVPRVVEKIVEVPRVVEKIVEKSVMYENKEKVNKLEVDVEKIRELNSKYLQVINEVNEELLKIKTETPRKINLLEDENKQLSQKVIELSNALVNAVNHNKNLTRALVFRGGR